MEADEMHVTYTLEIY